MSDIAEFSVFIKIFPLISGQNCRYIPFRNMRRVLSITMAVALISSLLSPVMAAACTHARAASCHRAAVQPQHCDGMNQHHHAMNAASSEPAAWTASDPGKCPMECCTQGHPRSVTAVPAISVLPPLAMTDQAVRFVSVIFTSTGFSSHTDRGPPAA